MTEKERAFVIVSSRDDLNISQELTKLVATDEASRYARVFVACPVTFLDGTGVWVSDLKTKTNVAIDVCPFDPFGDRKACHAAAEKLANALANYTIDLVFNWHGCSPGRYGVVLEESGMLEMAQVKVLVQMMLIEMLLQKKILSKGSRVVIAGSEAARGIPEIGFSVPTFGDDSIDSFVSILDGSALDRGNGNEIYGHVQAVLSLYIGSLARRHPELYVCCLSPGFTQDSMNENLFIEVVTRFFKLFMAFLFFVGVMGQDFTIAASNFLNAVTGTDWDYPSGSLVGAAKGMQGSLCDQSTLPGGAFLGDESKQDHAFEALKKFAII